MKRLLLAVARRWRGIVVGVLASVVFGWVYVAIFHEPGSAFYLFAGLAFVGAALIGGIAAALKEPARRRQAFLSAGGAVFGLACLLFLLDYMVLPEFARTSVELPAVCDGYEASLNLPPQLAYTWPDGGTGILLAGDAQTAVVATIDPHGPPFPGSVFIVNTSDGRIVRGMRFANDVISASLAEGIVYIYNDKLGWLLEAHTGAFEQNLLTIDNFGGLSESDRPFFPPPSSGHWYMETSAVISSWNVNGTVKSRPRLPFNSIARGCFISGDTGAVTKL